MSSDNKRAHLSEFIVMNEINNRLIRKGIVAVRPIGEMSQMYSPQDIYIKTFDLNSCTYGFDICKIDVERKENDTFDDFPFPPRRWIDWSFLGRKVDKDSNRDYDVYLLVDKNNSQNIFWITYGSIHQHYKREYLRAHRYVGERSSTVYRLPINDPNNCVQRGYDVLCAYLLSLRDGRVTLDAFGM